MNQFANLAVPVFGVSAIIIFIFGYYQSIIKKNPFQETPYLIIFGIFVWGDAVVLGLFWFLVSFVTFILKDWVLFLLLFSVFWTVRSFGETVYWLTQQFSPVNRNPPERLKCYHLFKNESIWFIYQIVWQCLFVISLITTIYLVKIFMI